MEASEVFVNLYVVSLLQIIDSSGLDAAFYLRVLAFGEHLKMDELRVRAVDVPLTSLSFVPGFELFFYISLWCLVTMLPVNLTVSVEFQPMAGYVQVGIPLPFSRCPSPRRLLQDNYVDVLMYTGNGNSSSDYQFTDFDKCGLANITLGSNRL